MFLDLQGAKCEFVDVEIATSLESETLFATGNLGVDSIRNIFLQHHCNYLYQSLNLSPQTPKTPEETVDSPSCAQGLCMSNVSDVLSLTADDLNPDAVDANSGTTELPQQGHILKKVGKRKRTSNTCPLKSQLREDHAVMSRMTSRMRRAARRNNSD